MDKLESLINNIGSKGKYQNLLSFLFVLIGMAIDFSILYATMMISPPQGYYKDPMTNIQTEGIFDNDFCSKFNNDYDNLTVSFEKSSNNWAIKYRLYCDKFNSSLYLLCLIFGYFSGLLLINLLGNVKRENILKALIIVFCLSCFLIYIESFIALLFMIFVHGLCHLSIFLLRSSIICNITDKASRNGFLTIQVLSGIFVGCIVPFIYSNSFDWRTVYTIISICLVIVFIILLIVMKDNPADLIVKGDIDEAIESAVYIGVFNDKIIDNMQSDTLILSNIKLDPNEENTQIVTDQDLRNWMKKDFSNMENELNHVEVNSDDTDTSSYPNSKIISLSVLIFCFSFILYINTFEVYNYTNNTNFDILYMISMVIALVLFFAFNVVVRFKILAKNRMIFLSLLVCLILRLVPLIKNSSFLAIYITQRAFINSTQLPLHSLIKKIFSDHSKLFTYTLITLIIQIVLCSVPFILLYLPNLIINIIYVSLCIIAIVFTFLSSQLTN